MENALAVLVLLLLGMIPLAIFGGISYLLWRIPRVGIALCPAFVGAVLFYIVTAIWPLDPFYIEEFQNAAGVELHEKTEVLKKHSSFPDLQGDYFVTAVLRTTDFDYMALAKGGSAANSCSAPSGLTARARSRTNFNQFDDQSGL